MSEPMSDDDFVRAFLDGALPPSQFHHRDHLRLAWSLSRSLGGDEASRVIADGIRRFATRHGHAEKYHETMTAFWARVVIHCARNRPDIADFPAFLTEFPRLLDKDLPYHHWRRETMLSAEARTRWVEPDLLALPA
jgi:CDP-diacylglycerol--glycerol-3-phosphate 3-phosphatidyltransferase